MLNLVWSLCFHIATRVEACATNALGRLYLRKRRGRRKQKTYSVGFGARKKGAHAKRQYKAPGAAPEGENNTRYVILTVFSDPTSSISMFGGVGCQLNKGVKRQRLEKVHSL